MNLNSEHRLRINQSYIVYTVQRDDALCPFELSRILGNVQQNRHRSLSSSVYIYYDIQFTHADHGSPRSSFITLSCAVRDHSINGSSITAYDFTSKFSVMSLARTCRDHNFEHRIHKLPIMVPLSHLCQPHSRYARVPLPFFPLLPSLYFEYWSISDAHFSTILDEIRESRPNQMQNTIRCSYFALMPIVQYVTRKVNRFQSEIKTRDRGSSSSRPS